MTRQNNIILITGVSGFLGSALAKFLLSKGEIVVGLKRSFSNNKNLADFVGHPNLKLFDIDKSGFEPIFKEYSVNIAIHAATSSSNRGGNISQIMDANVLLPLKLIDQLYINGCKVFINAGVFIPSGYVDTYYHSKKIFLECMQEYSKYLKIIDVQLQMLYGKNSSETQFVSKIILDFFHQAECLNLTQGLQKRDFIYIDDAIRAFDAIINNMNNFQDAYTAVELGNSSPVTIKYLIETIKNLTNNSTTTLHFGVVEYRENEIMCSKADTKILRSLGWTPVVKIDDGLKMTVDALKKAYFND